MVNNYKHLTYDQRCQISTLKERGDSQTEIARILGVNRSTIGRELKRNKSNDGYLHKEAHAKAQKRRNRFPNQKISEEMSKLIEEKVRLAWSPVQISGWIKRQGIRAISHETIYKHIWKDKRQGGDSL